MKRYFRSDLGPCRDLPDRNARLDCDGCRLGNEYANDLLGHDAADTERVASRSRPDRYRQIGVVAWLDAPAAKHR